MGGNVAPHFARVRACVFSDLINGSRQQKHEKLKSAIVREEKDDGKAEIFLGSVGRGGGGSGTAVMHLLTKL